MRRLATGYVKAPFGWQKYRHATLTAHHRFTLSVTGFIYRRGPDVPPTTFGCSIVTPSIDKLYGIQPSAVRAIDLFLVRYDNDQQASLSRHTDEGSITVSVLLNDHFEGGGTRYWNRVGGGDTVEQKAMPSRLVCFFSHTKLCMYCTVPFLVPLESHLGSL